MALKRVVSNRWGEGITWRKTGPDFPIRATDIYPSDFVLVVGVLAVVSSQ